MVVFDTSTLAIVFDPKAKIPLDPETGLAVERCADRIHHLIKTLSEQKHRIVIPTPVLAEYMVLGGADRNKRLQAFTTSRQFHVVSFDVRAAVECAEITDGGRGKLVEGESKAKVKFDRQIIAIAKAVGAKIIYTGDRGLAKCAQNNKLSTVMTWELPLPPQDSQIGLFDRDPFLQTRESAGDPFRPTDQN